MNPSPVPDLPRSMFQLIGTWHRSSFPALDTPQQAYLLLEVCAEKTAGDLANQPVNLSLVLDRSGSMAGEKLKALKEAACLVVSRLGPKDLLSIVAFDDIEPADLVVSAQPVLDRDRIGRKIEALQERGGTHMSTGMRQGLAQLRPGAEEGGRVSCMLLLTDGRTWEDQPVCLSLADEARQAGIPIHILGMGVGPGSDWDPRFLEELAQRSGGEWGLVDDPTHTAAVFEKILLAMQTAALTNARLTMRLAPGVTARTVWRVTPLISRLGQQALSAHDIQVFLGDLQRSSCQAILVELLLAAHSPGAHRLLQVDIQYSLPGLDQAAPQYKTSIEIPATFSAPNEPPGEVDTRMMNLIERVVAHKLQTQALDEAAVGDIARATQRLRAAATRLLELGQADLAQQAQQQAQALEDSGKIDLAAAQKMRFATRRLAEPDS